MSLAWPSSTRRVSQVIPAGPAKRLARAACRALLVCALLGSAPGANATLKVVPEKKGAEKGAEKGTAGAASPVAPAAREPASREPASRESAPKEPGAKDASGRDPAARDPGAKDLGAKDPVAREPHAREAGPKDSGKDSGRRDPVAKEPGGREGGGREPGAVPRARPEPGRVACSDELVALSLGTLGQDDIDRLRSKGCLPAIAAPK